jgi:hypothetical protein
MLSLAAEPRSRLAVACKTPARTFYGWAERSPSGRWQYALPADARAVNLVCMTQLPGLQYATKWAAAATVVGPARVGAVVQSEIPRYTWRANWRAKCTGVVRPVAPFILREHRPEPVPAAPSRWLGFDMTCLPHGKLSAANGWPPLGYLSPAMPRQGSAARLWCQCAGLAAIITGYDGVTPLGPDTQDLLLSVALRAVYPKYVSEFNCDGKPVDVRDPIGMTMMSNRDCDGAAMLICQFYNNVRALTPTAIRRAAGSPLIAGLAAELAARAQTAYREAVIVLGKARSPSKGPRGASFGHCWAALLPAAAGQPLLHVESTAPLCARRPGAAWPPAGFTRVYGVGDYPTPSPGVDYHGVREFEQWMYFKTWWAIGATFSANLHNAPWNEDLTWEQPPPAPHARELVEALKLMPILPLETLASCADAAADTADIVSLAAYDSVTGFTSAPVGGFPTPPQETAGAGNVLVVSLHRSPAAVPQG